MKVLISGAGIAGPTLAWFLAKTGASVTIVEKRPVITPQGHNVDVKGSSVAVLKKMGLLDKVKECFPQEKGTKFVNSDGKSFAKFPVEPGYAASLSSEYEILRGDLAMLLYKASVASPNVNYLFDTSVHSVLSNDTTGVTVKLSNNSVERFDLLVAADGQWSKIRQQCFSEEQVNVVDKGMYTAYWTIPRLPQDDDWWTIFVALRSRIVAMRPDRYGDMRAMITCMPCDEEQGRDWREAVRAGKDTQLQLLKKDFADAGWQSKRFLDAVSQSADFYFHLMQQIKMSRWSENRVVCLGDTAYAPTPLTGMGTSLAITGAYVLAGELSKVNDGSKDNITQALGEYENVFRSFVEETQRIPLFIPDLLHPEKGWKRTLLHGFISLLSRFLPLLAQIPQMKATFDRSNNEDFELPAYTAFDNDDCFENA